MNRHHAYRVPGSVSETRSYRKGAPTLIEIPTSPTKRSWKSYFRSTPSTRNSFDSGIHDSEQEASTPKQANRRDRGCSPSSAQHLTSENGNLAEGSQGVLNEGWQSFTDTNNHHDHLVHFHPTQLYNDHNIMNSDYSNYGTACFEQQQNNITASLAAHINDSLSSKQSVSTSSTGSRSRASTVQTTSSDAASISSSQTSQSIQSTQSKRSRDQDEDNKDMSDSYTRKGKKPRDQSPAHSQGQVKLFACPFAKHDARRYSHKNMSEPQYRNCCSGNWPDIPRLKQHLYRAHGRSNIDCRRCWQNFERTDTRDKHEKEQKCAIRDYPEERMTEKQQDIIRSRKQGKAHDLWNEIYKTLFSGSPLPASPYAELVVGEDLRASFSYMEQTLPRLLIDRLNESFQSLGRDYDALADLVGGLISNAMPMVMSNVREQFAVDNEITHILPLALSSTVQNQQESLKRKARRSTSSTSSLPVRSKQLHTQLMQAQQDSQLNLNVASHTQRPSTNTAVSRSSSNRFQLSLGNTHLPLSSHTQPEIPTSNDTPLTSIYHDVSHIGSGFATQTSPYTRFGEPDRKEYPFPMFDNAQRQQQEQQIITTNDDIATTVPAGVHFSDQLLYHDLVTDNQHEQDDMDIDTENGRRVNEFNSFSNDTGMEIFFTFRQ